MDFTPFLDPHFDHKQWINEVLKSTAADHNVEQQASELVLQLQAQMKELMQSIERSCQEAVHSVPRLLREVESLKIDATALEGELITVHDNISQVDSAGEHVITKLAELDQARRNAHAAANALRETDRWSSLVSGIGELLEAGELDQVCCHIEGMEQCLTALTHLPDYEDRSQLVAQHKNSLESLVAPQLLRALGQTIASDPDNSSDLSPRWTSPASLEAKHLISLLYRIGRESAAINYYTKWITSFIQSIWERCCTATLELDPTSAAYPFFSLLDNPSVPAEDPFCMQLDADDTILDKNRHILLIFYAHLLHLFSSQLSAQLFSELHSVAIVDAFVEALKALTNQRQTLIFGSDDQSKAARVDHVAQLLFLSFDCCAQFGKIIENQNLGKVCVGNSELESKHLHKACSELCRALLSPYNQFDELFGKQAKLRFDKELKGLKLDDIQATAGFIECLSQSLSASVRLINMAIQSCFNVSLGIGIPYLLNIIQTFWDSFLAKWTIAIDRSVEPFIATDTKVTFNQAPGFTCALQFASLTGELSLQCDSFVEAVLTKSTDLFFRILNDTDSSPLFGAGDFPRVSLWSSLHSFVASDWARLRLLIECQSDAYQNTVRLLAHPSSSASSNKTASMTVDDSKGLEMQTTLASLHRSNVSACRAAVSLLRRVALAPINRALSTVPTMSVWSFVPGSGEAKFPDLAYLPQDYITQVGQYLLTLPEHLEPYMSEVETDMEAMADASGRGLAECLHLGDPDSVALSLTVNKAPPEDMERDKTTTARRRLTSLSGRGKVEKSAETFTTAAFCWLETFVSGPVCELLVHTWLRIGNVVQQQRRRTKKQAPTRPDSTTRTKRDVSDSESELEDQIQLTEHGMKQLIVDLDYLRTLLEDMGLSYPGNLQTLYDLMGCPAHEFAEMSADRPPRIVSAVERLRGL